MNKKQKVAKKKHSKAIKRAKAKRKASLAAKKQPA